MFPRRFVTTVLSATLFLLPVAVHAQSAADLFQRALRAERVEGDLEEAIGLYRRVVEMDDRALAARALLRMGESYERLGREGAEEAYRRLVSEFADQADAAGAARDRLAALTVPALEAGTEPAGADGLNLRLLGPQEDPGRVQSATPDGTSLTSTQWRADGSAALTLTDVATREERVLKFEGGGSWPMTTAVSNDGRNVAFMWVPGPWRPQLRVVGTDGTGDRVLVDNATGEIDYVEPFDWTPDDGEVLVRVDWVDGHFSFGMVSVADGSMRTLRSFRPFVDGRSVARLSLSPDGRWVVYELERRPGRTTADIFVLATDGTAMRRIVSHPAIDTRPIWSPDGRHLLFISDRGGSVDLWALRVRDGTAEGEPFTVRRDVGPGFWPIRFTVDGELLFSRVGGDANVFAVDFDPETGRTVGTPERVVSTYQGYNNAPAWSRDGSRVVYLSRRHRLLEDNQANVIVRDEGTGREFEPAPDFRGHRRGSHPSISPDGRLIAIKTWPHGTDPDGWLHLIDVTDGSFRTLEEPARGGVCAFCPVAFSNDGTAVFYSTVIPAPTVDSFESCPMSEPRCVEYRGLIRHDLATGGHEPVFAWDLLPPFDQGSWGLSPDRTRIVTLLPDTVNHATIVHVGTLGTGGKIEIARFDHDEIGCAPAHGPAQPVWTESDWILFVCERPAQPGDDVMRQLMSLPVDGGEPQPTGLVMEVLRKITVRPDGRIGFAAGSSDRGELWTMSGLTAQLGIHESR